MASPPEQLVQQFGRRTIAFLIELTDLHGRERLAGYKVHAVISY